MMNAANEISHHTMLYGFIGIDAGVSSMSATLNKLFKANAKDAMMIPLNIREDDFYYTVVNMKKSHVNGALISKEYMTKVVELLDDASRIVKKSKMCDVLLRDGNRLFGDVITINALVDFLKSKDIKKVALIGIDERAKAFRIVAKDSFEISYFYDELEELMRFCDDVGLENADVNRIAEGMRVDFGIFDAVVDFSDFAKFDMIERLAKINVDMKPKKEFSALKVRANELNSSYVGFEDMLDFISKDIYEFLESKNHLNYDKSEMRF